MDRSRSPVTEECPGILTLLEPVAKVGRQTEAGVDPLAPQLLRSHWSNPGERQEGYDAQLEAIALGVDPESRRVFPLPFRSEQLLALLGVTLQRVVLRQIPAVRSSPASA